MWTTIWGFSCEIPKKLVGPHAILVLVPEVAPPAAEAEPPATEPAAPAEAATKLMRLMALGFSL